MLFRSRTAMERRHGISQEGALALCAGEVEHWSAGEAEKQRLREEDERLRLRGEEAHRVVEEVRERLLERRSARMTVETLVTEAARQARYELGRREQQELDEWFQIAGRGSAKHPFLKERVEETPER